MRITLNKKFGAAIAVAALALTMSACGAQKTASEQQSAASSSASKQQDSPLPSTDWVRADAADVQQGGTLTLSLTQLPTNWNSGQIDGALFDLTKIRLPMGGNDFLLGDEKGAVSLNPNYIESATLKSQDPEVIEVKYNKNAKWEDGSPITIADLASYVKAMSGKDKAYEVASTQGWEDISDVRQTADEFTGEITFGKKNVDWISYIYPDIPKSISDNATAFNSGYLTKATPSAGAFKIKSIDQKGQVVTLEPNPTWWGAKPKLDTIIFKVVSQVQGPQSFANKELDVLEASTQDEYETAKKRTDAKIQKTNGLTWTHVTMMAAKGPLADKEVRKAIGLALNREAVGKAVVGGLEAPIVLVNNAVFMPGQDGYEDSYGGELTYDPAKAGQILDAAGYAKGSDGVRAKGADKLTLNIVVPAESKSNGNRAAQIQKDLNAVGFKVELKSVPSDKYFSEYVSKKDFNLVTFSWVGTLFPIVSAANLFSPADSGQNFTGYANPEVATLNDQAQAEFDKAKRIEIANKMSKAMLGDYTIIPFYATPTIFAVKDGLVNYGAAQFESVDWTKVGWKK